MPRKLASEKRNFVYFSPFVVIVCSVLFFPWVTQRYGFYLWPILLVDQPSFTLVKWLKLALFFWGKDSCLWMSLLIGRQNPVHLLLFIIGLWSSLYWINFQHITLIFLHVFWCGKVWSSSSDSVWKTSGKNCPEFLYLHFRSTHYTLKRLAFIQPKIPEILAGTSD